MVGVVQLVGTVAFCFFDNSLGAIYKTLMRPKYFELV